MRLSVPATGGEMTPRPASFSKRSSSNRSGAIERSSARYPSSSSSLARTRSRSITRDLFEVAAIDVPKPLEGARGAGREVAQGILVSRDQHRAFLQDSASDIEGKLLEDDDVQVDFRQVRQPLLGPSQVGGWLGCGGPGKND